MTLPGDVDYQIKFKDGPFANYGTLDSKVSSNRIKKVGSININRRMNNTARITMMVDLNTSSNQITIGDTIYLYVETKLIFMGIVTRGERIRSKLSIKIQAKDPIVLMQRAQPHDDVVIEDESYDGEANDINESGGVYTTTLGPTNDLIPPLLKVEVLDTIDKELDSNTQAGVNAYETISLDDDEEGRLKFLGRNSVLNKVAVKVERAGGSSIDHVIEITEADGTSVWSDTIDDGDVPGAGSSAWVVKDVNVRLEGGKIYYLTLYGNSAGANKILWWYETSCPLKFYGQYSTDAGANWVDYYISASDYRACFNFELDYEDDFKPRYEGEHFTLAAKVITWGGEVGFKSPYDNHTRAVSATQKTIARVTYTTKGLTTQTIIEYAINSYCRRFFKTVELASTKTVYIDETLNWSDSTADKDENDENHNIENDTDNAFNDADEIVLGNRYGDTFKIASADADTWKFDVISGIHGNNNDGGAGNDINTAISDMLHIHTNAVGGTHSQGILLASEKATGDFDIQIDVRNYLDDAVGGGGYLMATADYTSTNDYIKVGLENDAGTQKAIGENQWNGAGVDDGKIAYPDDAVYLRITRVGTLVKGYYSTDGVTWSAPLITGTNGDTDDLQIVFFTEAPDGNNTDMDVNDYHYNSGGMTADQYQTSGEWTTWDIENKSAVEEIDIDFSNLSATETITIKILKASDDSVLWTSSTWTSGTDQTLTSSDFGTITDNYKIQVIFAGDGTTSPIVTHLSYKNEYPYGLNWVGYLFQQVDMHTVMKDMHSLDALEFHSVGDDGDDTFKFVTRRMVEPGDWNRIYSLGEREMRTFSCDKGDTDSYLKCIEHKYLSEFQGQVYWIGMRYKDGTDPPYEFPDDIDSGDGIEDHPYIDDLIIDHPYFDPDETGEFILEHNIQRSDITHQDEVIVIDVDLVYTHPTMGAQELFFTTNELYRIIDTRTGIDKIFKITEINYDFSETWTLRIKGIEDVTKFYPPDDDPTAAMFGESHGIHSSEQGFTKLNAKKTGSLVTINEHRRSPGMTPNLQHIFKYRPDNVSGDDIEKYSTSVHVMDPDYTWDLGSGDVFIAIGDDNSNPTTKAMQNELARVQGTYFDTVDRAGNDLKIINAEFDFSDLTASSTPYDMLEIGVYTLISGGTCKSRKAIWVPTSAENLADDKPAGAYYHPVKKFFRNTKLYVQVTCKR